MCNNGLWFSLPSGSEPPTQDLCTCVASMTAPITQQPQQPPLVMVAQCRDGMITPPTESCDGMNLNGATCQSLGYNGGGTLLCNPTTCTYDTIMCRMTVGNPGGAGMSGGAGMGGGGTGS
jgi:hypothetical protein